LTIEQIEEKITRRPQSPLFAFLAAQYLEHEEPERARELCIGGIDLYPTYSTAYYVLAKIFARESNFTSARESIQRAISLNPTSTTFLQFQTEIELQLLPAIEVPPHNVQSLEPAPINETEPIEFTTEGTEIPDEKTGLEEINEVPVEEIPGIDEPITLKDLDESGSNEDRPKTAVDESADSRPLQQENFNEELAVLPSVENDESHAIEIFDVEDTSPGYPLPDNIAIGEHSIVQNPVLTEDEISVTPSALHVDEFVVLSPSKEIATEIVPDVIGPELIAPEEIVEESTALPTGTDPGNIPEEEPTTAPRIDDSRIVSKTLAEIFASQGEYQEAIITYTLLKEMRPNLSVEIDTRIRELENLQRERTGQL
jgi:tetratricopeptide (TPR) repeat protein